MLKLLLILTIGSLLTNATPISPGARANTLASRVSLAQWNTPRQQRNQRGQVTYSQGNTWNYGSGSSQPALPSWASGLGGLPVPKGRKSGFTLAMILMLIPDSRSSGSSSHKFPRKPQASSIQTSCIVSLWRTCIRECR
jgi:hypothetical protein